MIERAVVDAIVSASEPLAVATVVGVRGSAYRRPGARLVFTRECALAGSVSGGCLEDEIVRTGWWHTENGPVVVTYDANDEDDVRRGTGCGGSIDILIERVGQSRIDPLAALTRCVSTQERGSLVTVVSSTDPRIGLGAFAVLHGVTGPTRRTTHRTRGGVLDVLIEELRPPPHLFVLGTGPDALEAASAARAIGWRVVVVAPSLRPSLRARFAHVDALVAHPMEELAAAIDSVDRAAVLVINHDLDRDRACLEMALGTRAAYIGVLGPRKRTDGMLAELGETTVARAAVDTRLHAPAGLSIGAEIPAEIALSIVAEAQAVLARAPASKLRDAAGAIHTGESAQTGAVSAVSLRLAGCSAA